MRSKQKLSLDQLEQRLKSYYSIAKIEVPSKGWINAIRAGVNMTLEQLGKKLGKTRQGIRMLELSEQQGSISLNNLKAIGGAMDMKLVYGFVPKDGSLEKLIERRSAELAKKIVKRTNQNMILESQGINQKKIDKAISELSQEIRRNLKKSMWD